MTDSFDSILHNRFFILFIHYSFLCILKMRFFDGSSVPANKQTNKHLHLQWYVEVCIELVATYVCNVKGYWNSIYV